MRRGSRIGGGWTMTKKQADKIVAVTARVFPSFGGGRVSNGYNPLADALKDREPMFAAGVDIRQVVEFVASKLKRKD